MNVEALRVHTLIIVIVLVIVPVCSVSRMMYLCGHVVINNFQLRLLLGFTQDLQFSQFN